MGNLRKETIVAVLGVFILGVVFSASLVGCNKEDEAVGAKNDELVPRGDIPAIDAYTPVRTETATFALG